MGQFPLIPSANLVYEILSRAPPGLTFTEIKAVPYDRRILTPYTGIIKGTRKGKMLSGKSVDLALKELLSNGLVIKERGRWKVTRASPGKIMKDQLLYFLNEEKGKGKKSINDLVKTSWPLDKKSWPSIRQAWLRCDFPIEVIKSLENDKEIWEKAQDLAFLINQILQKFYRGNEILPKSLAIAKKLYPKKSYKYIIESAKADSASVRSANNRAIMVLPITGFNYTPMVFREGKMTMLSE